MPEDERIIDGRYRVEGMLGKGGMGAVFRVLDLTSKRQLALKQLSGGDSGDTRRLQAVLRFRREFHTIAGLSHPSIVKVFDYGVDDGSPYYTMELLEGKDLRDLEGCDVETACRLLRDVASALALLHARRLLHRDLKPHNVRCDAKGRARLIDFGVLATMGVSGEIAGTLPSIPPEAVRGLPLDGRSDLFGLGALMYWLLTRRHAYPARSVAQLESLWADEVPPPSELRPEVSPAVDALVMSLLAIAPDARPSTAADVVAAIEAAASLPPDPGLAVARGWLMSASLVGRSKEMATIQDAIDGALVGRGALVAIEAGTGLGKTRLTREAGLRAQVAGMLVVHARGRADERYAVVRQLARGLLRTAPATVKLAASGLGTLSTSVPELASAVGETGRQAAGDEAEERVLRQEQLREFVLEVAAAKPLAIVIDDVQRSDEASAALLASLGAAAARASLLVVAAVRTDEVPEAAGAVNAIRSGARRLSLSGLSQSGVQELCGALFGRASGLERLAAWMHKAGGGSPLYTSELAQHLVDTKVIRYDAGAWQIPDSFEGLGLPEQLAAAVQVRLQTLGAGARRLGRVLSLVEGRTSVELCHALSGDDDTGVVFAALDELVQAGVLLEGERGLEFIHDAMRDEFQRALGADEAKRMHLRIAAALAAAAEQDERVLMEVGWHHLRGGEEEKGAELLERAGRILYEAQSFADARRPLEAALEVYDLHDGPRKRRLELRQMLMRGGVIAGHETVRKHADAAIAAFSDDAGLDVARRLGRFVGGFLGFLLGVGFAWVRWIFDRHRRFRPTDAITSTVALVNYAASVHSLGYDLEPLRRLRERMRPLGALKNRVPGGAYLLIENFYALAVGHFDVVIRNCERARSIVVTDRLTPLSDLDRELALGATWFMEASVLALDQEPDYVRAIEKLEASKLKLFELSTITTRAFFHRLRGEETRAEELIASSRFVAVQLGNAWVVESQLSWISAMAYAVSGDATGMKRTLQQLAEFEQEGFRFDRWRLLLEGEYARVRGELDAALESLAELDRRVAEEDLLMQSLAAAARADVLFARKDFAAAATEAERGLQLRWEGIGLLSTVELRLGRALGLAWAGLGRYAESRAELKRRLGQADKIESPLLQGVLHEAAALAARMAEDTALERYHAKRCAATFRRTSNPILVARARRLLGRDVRPSDEVEGETLADHTSNTPTNVLETR